jgi:hypothetical protein
MHIEYIRNFEYRSPLKTVYIMSFRKLLALALASVALVPVLVLAL